MRTVGAVNLTRAWLASSQSVAFKFSVGLSVAGRCVAGSCWGSRSAVRQGPLLTRMRAEFGVSAAVWRVMVPAAEPMVS